MEQKLSNPGPLGLTGFGLTTILLNLHNAGFFELNSMIMGMGLFFGGLAQMIAGRLEFQKGNTFGTTAFSAYGAFWISLVFTWILPKMGLAKAPDHVAMGFFLLLWGIFTAFMILGTLKSNFMLKMVFVTLTILFFLLAAATFTESHILHVVAGWEGIICGASALYLAMAEVINEVHGKTILPIGE